MRLIGDVGDGGRPLCIAQLSVPRGGQRGQVRHGAAGDEEPAASIGIARESAHPANERLLYTSSGGSVHPAPCVRVECIGHDVAHPGKEGDGAGDARKAAGMLHQRVLCVHVAEHFPVDLVDRTAFPRNPARQETLERFTVRLTENVFLADMPVKPENRIDKFLHQFSGAVELSFHRCLHGSASLVRLTFFRHYCTIKPVDL